VPKLTVITRKAYGGAYDVMSSKVGWVGGLSRGGVREVSGRCFSWQGGGGGVVLRGAGRLVLALHKPAASIQCSSNPAE